MHELLKHNISLVEPAAQSKDILIKLNGQDNICAYADRNMMNTVARNLLSNAIKFSFPGGLITIDLSLKDNRTVLVSVKDNGFGMNPEIQGNLFRIEHRMVTKGTNNETGTGLGLILCKDFITRNNGEIRVESEEGAGSTFISRYRQVFLSPRSGILRFRNKPEPISMYVNDFDRRIGFKEFAKPGNEHIHAPAVEIIISSPDCLQCLFP